MRARTNQAAARTALLPVLLCAAVVCTAGCAASSVAGPFSRKTQLAKVVFAAVDVETTGLDSKTDRIVEIGVVKFCNGRKTGSRSWLVNPGIPIPPSAVKVHGITTDMVGKSPDFGTIFAQFKAFVGDSVILAHNARYDVSFFNAEVRRSDLEPVQNQVVDTLPVFRQWFPKASRHTMAFMIEYLHINAGVLHRGQSDAASLYEVFKVGVAERSSKLTLDDLINTAGGELHFAAKEEPDKAKE